MKRIEHHPILEDLGEAKTVEITVDGTPIRARAGEPIAAALLAAGIQAFRETHKGSPRGLFCGIGQCTDCCMTVNGRPNVRTCVTQVAPGMVIETQRGNGRC